MISRRLRLSAIQFLNPAPLMWSFEHEPDRSRLLERYVIEPATPAECAMKLASGEADIGLIPVAGYRESLAVVPGCAIASRDRVRSILLVVRHPDGSTPANGSAPDGVAHVRRVALDTASLTSATYTRILFDRFWKTRPEFVAHPPDLEAMLRIADAALLIGDPALFALEDREARERRTGERLLYLDLAHEWHRFTGTVWVSAFWAVRPEALQASGISSAQVIQDLHNSRDAGLANIEHLAAEWASRITVPRETICAYLSHNIWYYLDEPCLHGLELFYRYGVECGALPVAPAPRFF